VAVRAMDTVKIADAHQRRPEANGNILEFVKDLHLFLVFVTSAGKTADSSRDNAALGNDNIDQVFILTTTQELLGALCD
jgi:hypothetical protein